jgi:hypothetical protein
MAWSFIAHAAVAIRAGKLASGLPAGHGEAVDHN